MGFCFSSPKKKDILADDAQILADNARTLSVCVEIAEGDLRADVEKLYDKVKYMTPTAEPGATLSDKKIGALAGDLKIALSKGERTLLQAADIVKDLTRAVADRNSYGK